MNTIELTFHAPIPVGHRVELRWAKPLPLQWDPIEGAQIESSLSGRVLGCRVTTYNPHVKDVDVRLQTTLIVQPD